MALEENDVQSIIDGTSQIPPEVTPIYNIYVQYLKKCQALVHSVTCKWISLLVLICHNNVHSAISI